MAGDAKVKIILERVRFTRSGLRACTVAGVKYLAMTNDGTNVETFGEHDRVFKPRETPTSRLNWSQEVDVKDCETIKLTFECKENTAGVGVGKSLGKITYTLRKPWKQHKRIETTVRNRNYTLVWTVQLSVGGAFGIHGPKSVFASRQHQGSVEYSTVAGVVKNVRMEICPVWPVPPDDELPRRFDFPEGTPGPKIARDGRPLNIKASSPVNILPNPAVIPLLSAPRGKNDPQLPDGSPPEATGNTAARLQYTYYRPKDLAFKPDDPRLEWRKISGTGDVAFLPVGTSVSARNKANKGWKVLVYGTTEGEVVLGVYFEGTVLARIRAMVYPVKSLPCRFNILYANPPDGGKAKDYRPISTPNDIEKHRKIANIFLRQVGVELVRDADLTTTDGATRCTIGGIFKVCVPENQTVNATVANIEEGMKKNYRNNVLNFVYFHSGAGGFLGAALAWPKSNQGDGTRANVSFTEAAANSPSSSWIKPSGVKRDADAGDVSMRIIDDRAIAGHASLFGMVIANGNGSKPGGEHAVRYGNTIAHEVGHMMTLGHRVEEIDDAGKASDWADGSLTVDDGGGIADFALTAKDGTLKNDKLGAGEGMYCDGLWHPKNRNLMHFDATPDVAQDLDILQAKAVRQCKLLDTAP